MRLKILKYVMLAAALIAAAALCGCRKQEKEESGTARGPEDEQIYVGKYRTLSARDGYQISDAVLGEDGSVFYLEGNQFEVNLFAMDLETGESSRISLPLEENMIPSGLGTDSEGNLLLYAVGYEDLEAAEPVPDRVVLKKLSQSGEELLSVDVGDVFLQNPDFYITKLLLDKEGNFYVCTGTDIFVLDQQGAVRGKISPGQYISNLFLAGNGKVMAAYYGERDFEVREVSPDFRELAPVKSSVSFGYGTYQGSPDSDLLYTVEDALYSMNLSDEKPEEILRWTKVDVNAAFLQDFKLLPDGRVAALTNDFTLGEGGQELIVLERKNRSEVPEKEVLTYGAYYLSFYAQRDISAFNRQSEKYRIEVKEYGDGGSDISEKFDLFAADLTGGKAPDIIDLTYCPMSLEALIQAGVVEDLNPYLDKDDIIAREDYVESALETWERDGKLYAVMPYYGVDAIVGKTSIVGGEKSWTLEDVMELASLHGSGTELLPGADRQQILFLMCTMNQDLFVDAGSGKCDFTVEEFRKILEFVKSFPGEANYDLSLDKLRSGEILLYRDTITSVQQYQMFEFMFSEPVNLIGYPTFGESGLTLSSNGTTAAMSAASENKEGVWEFIRFNVTKDRQENVGSPNGGFPILRSALEKQFENDREPVYGKDENGARKEMPKSTWSFNVGSDQLSVEAYAATRKQTDQMMEMIETAQPNKRMDQEIFGIIMEEASGYFEDQKSLESVTEVIQNRVQLYLNETR